MRLRNRDGVSANHIELALADTRVAAGAPLHAQLRGLRQPAEVALLRVETCPSGRVALPIATCSVEPGEDVSLAVPPDTPPTVFGRECALSFAVRVHSPPSGRRPAHVSVPVTVHGGEQPVHEAVHLFDRMIASFPARGFHVELSEAVLEGGGRIAGRVHLHDRAPRSIEVAVRCEETWRTNHQYRNRRQPPLWRSERLWRDSIAMERDPDRSWQPFAFAIPAGLPAAVEGHIVCWRYEVEARRRGRVGRSERAVVTPLRFDIE